MFELALQGTFIIFSGRLPAAVHLITQIILDMIIVDNKKDAFQMWQVFIVRQLDTKFKRAKCPKLAFKNVFKLNLESLFQRLGANHVEHGHKNKAIDMHSSPSFSLSSYL
jgi:hypothetical protein